MVGIKKSQVKTSSRWVDEWDVCLAANSEHSFKKIKVQDKIFIPGRMEKQR